MSRPSAERRQTKRTQRRPPGRPTKNRHQRTPPEPARPPRQRHRQITPPTRSAKSLRQRTPPSRAAREREAKSGNRRRPKHPDRSLPILASKRVDQSRGEPALPLGTPPTRSAKQVRQLTPPSSFASQRAPTAGDHHPRQATCRSSHQGVPISSGSIPYRHSRHRQRGPPSWSAD